MLTLLLTGAVCSVGRLHGYTIVSTLRACILEQLHSQGGGKVNFNDLAFGAPAAERDIDIGLDDYFVESEAYQRVSQGGKTIVLGMRGSKKSAIFKVLATREKQHGSIVLELGCKGVKSALDS